MKNKIAKEKKKPGTRIVGWFDILVLISFVILAASVAKYIDYLYVLGGLCLLTAVIFIMAKLRVKDYVADGPDENPLGLSEQELKEAMAAEPVIVTRVGAAAARRAAKVSQPVAVARDEMSAAQPVVTAESRLPVGSDGVEALGAELDGEILRINAYMETPVADTEAQTAVQQDALEEDVGDFVNLLGALGMTDLFRETKTATGEIYIKERDDAEIDNFFNKYHFAS